MRNNSYIIFSHIFRFILLMIFNNVYAQCIIDNNLNDAISSIELNHVGETHSYGQSFVSDCNGNIEYFEISNSTQEGYFDVQTIEIYNGTDFNATPIYTQAYDQVTIFSTGESFVFVIDNNIELLSGNVYTIIVTFSGASFLISDTDNYNSGSAIIDGVIQTDKDLFFKVLLSDTNDNCNIGNEYIMGDATNIVSGSSGNTHYLQLLPLSLSNTGNLTGLGYTGINSNGQIRMALYDDLNNAPNNLLAETAIEDFDFGKQTLSVTPVTLSPGNYWISYMVNAPTNTSLWRVDSYEPIEDYYYLSLDTFGSNLPNPFVGGTMSINDTKYPLFAEISCDFLNVEEFEYQKIEMYPNPTSGKLYFKGIHKDTAYTIYSLLGKKVLYGKIIDDSFINLSHLNDGLYIVRLENGFNYKFVKE